MFNKCLLKCKVGITFPFLFFGPRSLSSRLLLSSLPHIVVIANFSRFHVGAEGECGGFPGGFLGLAVLPPRLTLSVVGHIDNNDEWWGGGEEGRGSRGIQISC